MKRLIYLAIIILMFTGCDLVQKKSKKTTVVKKPTLDKVDDLNLAKIILKPERSDISVTRDPFKPLIQEEEKQTVVRNTIGNQELKRYKFLGVAKVNNEYVAYLKSGAVKGTFRKDDKLKDYTITEIGPDEVVLSNGDQTITLKRGTSK
ncbi:MAG: hypothetical protein AB7S78_07170 [Candidatus Omnitrophota bacterium]